MLTLKEPRYSKPDAHRAPIQLAACTALKQRCSIAAYAEKLVAMPPAKAKSTASKKKKPTHHPLEAEK